MMIAGLTNLSCTLVQSFNKQPHQVKNCYHKCDTQQSKCKLSIRQHTVTSLNTLFFINIDQNKLENHKWA